MPTFGMIVVTYVNHLLLVQLPPVISNRNRNRGTESPCTVLRELLRPLQDTRSVVANEDLLKIDMCTPETM
ncbi:hypothetical protein BOTCAL_0060g00320 [Botryotinia calthae]|uniref:Uncharacterized protein n=1 Tax=Botryotinia calthae TaxID=38488 RepID=A0A4Y8DAG9_9HELO|nr:hypothetical protein BOTCAL_0060g00320 [Botryotinia calthae]